MYALVPETGELLWKYDAAPVALRGLAYWPGTGGLHSRVFAGNGPFPAGARCDHRQARAGIRERRPGGSEEGRARAICRMARYALQSPPAVFGDVVITGCSNGEGSPTQGAYGDIRGWDAKTGKLLWTFHTVPRPGEAGAETWPAGGWKNRSGTNVWGFFTDRREARNRVRAAGFADLRFLWRGPRRRQPVRELAGGARCPHRARRNGTGSWCITTSGTMIWPRRPRCSTFAATGASFPRSRRSPRWVCLFVFDRVTGEPVYGMEERPVPQTDDSRRGDGEDPAFSLEASAAGERTRFGLEEMYDRSPDHARFCKELFAEQPDDRSELPYTPLPLEGNALFFPSTLGGGNWGGVSVDPGSGPVVRQRHERGAVGPHGEARRRSTCGPPPTDPTRGSGIARRGCPARIRRSARLIAVDLASGEIAWRVAAGQDRGARSDRRPRYRNAEPRRQHRHGRRPGVHRRD